MIFVMAASSQNLKMPRGKPLRLAVAVAVLDIFANITMLAALHLAAVAGQHPDLAVSGGDGRVGDGRAARAGDPLAGDRHGAGHGIRGDDRLVLTAYDPTMAERPVTKLDKSAVLSGLFAVWDDLDALLAGLTEADWRAASPLPGWDVKALVSHVIGTESFLAGIAAPQPDIDVKTLEHVRNDIGAMNECWVRHLGAHADADVLESFRAITDDRRAA